MSEVKMHTMGTPDEKDRTDQILLHYEIYYEHFIVRRILKNVGS